jgi:hypothetical protein
MRAAVTFGCSRNPGAQQNAVEVSSQAFNLYPFGIRHLGHFLRLDLQHHRTLVQDLLCFRLFSRARGTASGLPVKNTAVPGTRIGGRRAKLARNERNDGAPRYSRWNNAWRPVRQVDIRAQTAAAKAIGSRPPAGS